MKILFIILACLVINATACRKCKGDCTSVTITKVSPGCQGWGILVKGTIYPSKNIPAAFQHTNMIVCASYDLYEDMAVCICCGGTWANIKSMK